MDLVVFSSQELVAVARALRGIALVNGVFTDEEKDLVEGVATMHGITLDANALEPITPEELAEVVVDPHKRKRALQLAVVTSLVEGTPTEETERALGVLARGLSLGDRDIEVVRELAHGQIAFARFDMMRRLTGNMFKGMPIASIAKQIVTTVTGLGENKALAERYRALGALPEGSFGRAFHDHYVTHGFPFPGEKRGIPERGIFHDAGHVLAGYDVNPAGEIQQAAFQAGFLRNDGFAFFLFAILQFHIGVRITPIAKGETGFFDVKKVLRAAERGAACNVDLSDGWDFWSVVEVPVAELRQRYGIPAA